MRSQQEKRQMMARYGTTEISREVTDRDLEQLARDVVNKAGEKNEPSDHTRRVTVQIFEHKIVDGKMTLQSRGTKSVQPYVRPLTESEYETKIAEVIGDLPEEFQEYVRSESYERGHSAGYEEVLSYATSMAYTLDTVIKKYNKRMSDTAWKRK